MIDWREERTLVPLSKDDHLGQGRRADSEAASLIVSGLVLPLLLVVVLLYGLYRLNGGGMAFPLG